ncbi:MAG: hypothetical protein OEY18_16505 [Candidatus Aminicenantes bacterium]|jgi:hypothetical protein|nr:hypothetical protein [Candidatus Aminicenantes bacterium]
MKINKIISRTCDAIGKGKVPCYPVVKRLPVEYEVREEPGILYEFDYIVEQKFCL